MQQEAQVGRGRLGARDGQEHGIDYRRTGPARRPDYLPAAPGLAVNLRPRRCVPLVKEGAATWVMKEASRKPVSGHEPLIRIRFGLASTGRDGPSPSHQTRICRARNIRCDPGPTCVPVRVRTASGSLQRGRIRCATRSSRRLRCATRSSRRTRRPPGGRPVRRCRAARSAGGITTATSLPTGSSHPGNGHGGNSHGGNSQHRGTPGSGIPRTSRSRSGPAMPRPAGRSRTRTGTRPTSRPRSSCPAPWPRGSSLPRPRRPATGPGNPRPTRSPALTWPGSRPRALAGPGRRCRRPRTRAGRPCPPRPAGRAGRRSSPGRPG